GRDGVLSHQDTRAIGLAVVALGGGRRRPGESVDPRVGLSGVCPLGAAVRAGEPLAWVHASSEAAAERVLATLAPAFGLSDEPIDQADSPAVRERIDGRSPQGLQS
ncbi:MAG: hypothetical protein ACKO6D_00150, partial [Rubrivivax sp.]